MKSYLTNDEIVLQVKKLNVCNPSFHQWEEPKAQKNHIDLFGKEIIEGEYYFRLQLDSRYNDIKLSRDSMDKFLYALFAPNPTWEKDADENIKIRNEKIKTIINKLR